MNLNQVTVPSLDVSRAVVFYKKLGLRLIVDALPHYVRFECPQGEATFSIHLVDALPKGDGVKVYFESGDLDTEVARLKSEGVIFDAEPRDEPWLWREARLKDPDQNQLVLFHAGVNRKNPPWKVAE
ncbi:MAG: VOC family protein [Eudoraea sp.]|nr:VOC family protein [Eudoraea sp.]NNJ40441.1 VOC family protein [Eudoraea sp.]